MSSPVSPLADWKHPSVIQGSPAAAASSFNSVVFPHIPPIASHSSCPPHQSIHPSTAQSVGAVPGAQTVEAGLFYVPTNHGMDYEPFRVTYTAGQPHVGATLSTYPRADESHMGNFVAWGDARNGKIVWSKQRAALGLVGCPGDFE